MVTFGLRRLVCFAIAFAMSGSPAVISACMALCLPDGPRAASHGTAAFEQPSHPPAPAAPSAHAHHVADAAPDSSAGDLPPVEHPDARVIAGCDDCCPDESSALVAGLGAQRMNAHPSLAAPPSELEAVRFASVSSIVGLSPPGPPVRPPSPAASRLVLRI
jgi:hypothetical protein